MHPELKEAVLHGTQEYPFALYRVRGGGHGRSTPPHWHEETEIVYVEAGTLHLTIGEESFTGNAGGLFLVNGGQIHSMTFDRPETQYLTILFPISSLQFLNLDGSRNFLLSSTLGVRRMAAVCPAAAIAAKPLSDAGEVTGS